MHEWFHCGILFSQGVTELRERRCVVPEVRHTDALRSLHWRTDLQPLRANMGSYA